MQYFSKINPKSIWSKVNKYKVDDSISQNLMQPAGSISVGIAKRNDTWFILDDAQALIIPKDLKKEFNQRKGIKILQQLK